MLSALYMVLFLLYYSKIGSILHNSAISYSPQSLIYILVVVFIIKGNVYSMIASLSLSTLVQRLLI